MTSAKKLIFISLLAVVLAQNDPEMTTSVPAISSSSSAAPVPSRTTTTSTESPAVVVPPEPTSNIPQWTVKSSNSTCVLLKGNFTFAVTYNSPAGNAISDRVDIPKSAQTSGTCGPFLNSLVLTWDQGNLTFMFIKKPIYNAGLDTGNGSYSLTTIFGRLTVKNPNDVDSTTATNSSSNDANNDPSSPRRGGTGGNRNGNNIWGEGGQTFYITVRQPGGFMATSLHKSYSCESFQSIPADAAGKVNLEMRNVQMEAFHDGLTTEFNQSEPCTKDMVTSVLSIVGYVALALLIAAVAGYLIWKKLGRAGYTEV